MGSAKYGTMPGFCVSTREARYKISHVAEAMQDGQDTNKLEDTNSNDQTVHVNVTQGEAQIACYAEGDGYHLLSENEWLTLADNIIRNTDNDIDDLREGLQLMTAANASSTDTVFTLLSGAEIYNLVGGVAEWTDYMVPSAGILEPRLESWQEYYSVSDYKGLNINPPYYYASNMGIGQVKTGIASSSLHGFVRGENALYDLDLTYSPITATSTIGFRCAR